MNQDQEAALLKLAAELMKNEKAEAEAVEGYTQQLNVIREAKMLFSIPEESAIEGDRGDTEVIEYLDKLEAATQEKIQDELNHGQSLYEEFTAMTGIQPAKE